MMSILTSKEKLEGGPALGLKVRLQAKDLRKITVILCETMRYCFFLSFDE